MDFEYISRYNSEKTDTYQKKALLEQAQIFAKTVGSNNSKTLFYFQT